MTPINMNNALKDAIEGTANDISVYVVNRDSSCKILESGPKDIWEHLLPLEGILQYHPVGKQRCLLDQAFELRP